MVDPRLYCSSCTRCSARSTNACYKWGFRGLSGGGGGFSEYVVVDEKMCYALPDSVDLDHAALLEPLAVAWRAVNTFSSNSLDGKSALIIGGGPVGIAVIYVLRARGCKNIIVSEPTLQRRQQCAELADSVIDPTQQGKKVGDHVQAATGGQGAEVAFDCAGTQPGLQDGVDALAFQGTYVNVALWEKPVFTILFPFSVLIRS